MTARRSSDRMPDLFSAAAQPRANEAFASGFKTKATLHNQGAAPKHLLPKEIWPAPYSGLKTVKSIPCLLRLLPKQIAVAGFRNSGRARSDA